ncbi:hypothetical protein KAJ27_06325 [bacterium]|nr:hypothetical protein [bacterium]
MKIKMVCMMILFFSCCILLNASTVQYLNKIADQKYVSKGDCLKCVAYFLGKRKVGNISNVIRFLKKKKVLRRNAKVNIEGHANRGYLSQLLVRALELKWGMWSSLLGNRYRTAYRQLLKYKIMPSGGWRYMMDGTELIGSITRANQFKQGVRLW